MLEWPSPVHPMVVHFPIALFSTALGLEIASIVFKKDSLHTSALHLYILAALTTPLVVRTGLWEEERLSLNHPVLDWHRTFALWTMWVSLMSLPVLWFMSRKCRRCFRIIFVVFLLGVVSFVSLAGYNGGRLVYEYGAGIEE